MNNCSAPYTYTQYNMTTSLFSPSTVHASASGLSQFFQRYFLQRAISVFKWELPAHWASNYFLSVLYLWGYLAVFNTDKFGVIPQGCGLRGYNVFYQPTHATISNPLFTQGLLDIPIGRKCEIIKISPDYQGVYDLISYYGDQMALCAQALAGNLLNSKLAYVFFAGNKNVADSLKKMYDSIASGEPAVVIDKELQSKNSDKAWDVFAQNLKANHIATDLLNEMRLIQNMFDAEVGIPSANTEKRERLITSEVMANRVETVSKAALWLENIRECVDKVNSMFNLDIKVDWRFPVEEVTGFADAAVGVDSNTA